MEGYIWSLKKKEIYKKFNTHPKHGLTENQASERLEKFGFNIIPTIPQSFWKIYLAPLFNWLIIIYLIAALIMFFVGIFTDESNMSMIYITLAIVGLNSCVAIFQQARATKKLKALHELSAPTTKVIREGQLVEILTKNIVVGDLLSFSPGDKIPADSRIIKSANMMVNEASLTGEAEPIRKNHGSAIENIELHLQNQKNILFYGTYITTGTGNAIVVAIGGDTEIGKISKGLEEANTNEIPIRKKLNNIGKWFGIGVIGIWIIIITILKITTSEIDVIQSLNSAMDIMPINIPLLTTVVMLTGVLAMANHGVIIRNLTSVDSLGRVSVVCSDKTGTLTKSQMCVQHIWARGSSFKVTGSGYNPTGEIYLNDNPETPMLVDNFDDYYHLKLILESGYLNNNASLVKHEFEVGKKELSDWKVIGNPTDGSLITLYKKILDLENLENYKEIHEYPFSSQDKRMSKIFKNDKGKYNLYTKGASEVLFSICSKMLAEEGTSVDFIVELKLIIMNTINKYARKGYRILSFAYKPLGKLPENLEDKREEMESDLTFIGFVAIMDPPREGVEEAVKKCNNAGINVIMITGDSLNTAKAISSQISILNKNDKNNVQKCLEGNKIDSIESFEDLKKVNVFARVSPKHKQIIVEKYQENGHVVAMTGDGVNDALALNMADAGIAMGIQGTDVAKEASDMIISDDSFSSIVEGIHRGRGIFSNIRSLVFFFICINLFEGIVQFIIAIILKKPYFLDDNFYFQWIFISLTLHMFPGFILTFDKVSDDVMKEKPRNSEEIISNKFLVLMLIYGMLLAISMSLSYFLGIKQIIDVQPGNTDFGSLNSYYLYTSETAAYTTGIDLYVAKTLTMVMTTLFFCESSLALQIRRPNKSLIKSFKEDGTFLMYLITGMLFSVFLSIMYIPGLQILLADLGFSFNFMVLTITDWLICFGISMICIGTFELAKFIARKNDIIF